MVQFKPDHYAQFNPEKVVQFKPDLLVYYTQILHLTKGVFLCLKFKYQPTSYDIIITVVFKRLILFRNKFQNQK